MLVRYQDDASFVALRYEKNGPGRASHYYSNAFTPEPSVRHFGLYILVIHESAFKTCRSCYSFRRRPAPWFRSRVPARDTTVNDWKGRSGLGAAASASATAVEEEWCKDQVVAFDKVVNLLWAVGSRSSTPRQPPLTTANPSVP